MTVRTGGTGAITVIVCALTELVKPISADISAAAFVTTPKAVPLTVNVTVQTAPAATLMPLVVKGCVAFTAVKVGAPQLLLLGAVGFAIVNPLRKVSLNVIPVLLTAFAALLSIVKESVVVCPRSTEDVAKALVSSGTGGTMMSSAVLVAPLKFVIVAPVAVVAVLALLLYMPATTAAPTAAVKVKSTLPPAGMVNPPQTGAAAPIAGVVVVGLSEPPFNAIAPVAAYMKPAGNTSVRVTPVAGQLPNPAVLVTVSV